MESLIEHLSYAGVVLILLASGFGLPIPEDLPLILGGYLCGKGNANIWIMVPVTLVAVLVADMIVFLIGRRYGHHVPRLPLFRTFLGEKRLAKAAKYFESHGGKTLFLARFMPGLRAPCYFSAGLFNISVWKMLMIDAAAAILSVPMWVLTSWYFAKTYDLETIKSWSLTAQVTLVLTIIAIVSALIGWRVLRGRRVASPA